MKALTLTMVLCTCAVSMVAAQESFTLTETKTGHEFKGVVADAKKLRVVSYNIRHGQGMDGRLDLKRTAGVLREFSADLIALQEVDEKCTRSDGVDQAAELGRHLEMHHAFGMFMNYQGGRYGLAVLSRYPITKTIRHELPRGAEPRCALEVVVQPAACATPISFVCIHNDWTTEERRMPQVQALMKALAERAHPTILAGDFNTGPSSDSMKLMRSAGWTVLGKDGQQETWPADKPTKELDHIVTRGLPVEGVAVHVDDEREASDHRPLYTRIPLVRNGAESPPQK